MMNSNDQNKFKEIITAISETYAKEFTSSELKIWWNVFKPHSIEDFEAGVYQHMANPEDGMFAPKPAHIIKHIKGATKQKEQGLRDQAEVAWSDVYHQIARVGSYGQFKSDDKRAVQAVRMLGGWKHICSQTTDQLTWMKKEFINIYGTINRIEDCEALEHKQGELNRLNKL